MEEKKKHGHRSKSVIDINLNSDENENYNNKLKNKNNNNINSTKESSKEINKKENKKMEKNEYQPYRYGGEIDRQKSWKYNNNINVIKNNDDYYEQSKNYNNNYNNFKQNEDTKDYNNETHHPIDSVNESSYRSEEICQKKKRNRNRSMDDEKRCRGDIVKCQCIIF